ncbi:hypothetical protein EON63_11355 [archaeon]|nr:MAG: hypothetical protein EON63_11355 [archaeon]
MMMMNSLNGLPDLQIPRNLALTRTFVALMILYFSYILCLFGMITCLRKSGIVPLRPRLICGKSLNLLKRYLKVGFVTDLEGDWAYWQHYLRQSRVLYKDNESKALTLRENTMFVFGGDSVDRGPGDMRILSDLIALKERYPSRVFFILGNRDINKLRLPFSLHDSTLQRHEPKVYWLRNEHDREAAKAMVTEGSRESKMKWVSKQAHCHLSLISDCYFTLSIYVL